MPHATANGNGRSSGRFASARADVEEQIVDYQAEMHEAAAKPATLATDIERAIAEDAASDATRFTYYQRIERAIRNGAPAHLTLEAFHALVVHVEADEAIEDDRRHGLVPALRHLSAKVVRLRLIFREDFVPRILDAFIKGERR